MAIAWLLTVHTYTESVLALAGGRKMAGAVWVLSITHELVVVILQRSRSFSCCTRGSTWLLVMREIGGSVRVKDSQLAYS